MFTTKKSTLKTSAATVILMLSTAAACASGDNYETYETYETYEAMTAGDALCSRSAECSGVYMPADEFEACAQSANQTIGTELANLNSAVSCINSVSCDDLASGVCDDMVDSAPIYASPASDDPVDLIQVQLFAFIFQNTICHHAGHC